MSSSKVSLTPLAMPDMSQLSVPVNNIPPIERIRFFSDEQFEAFITEWAVSCIKPACREVYNLGGAGDKGRDVIAEFDDGTFVYYQCKKYDHALMPSDIYVELGKFCYFTHCNLIAMPTKYYFVCPYDVGPTLYDLLRNPTQLRNELLTHWDNSCQDKISKGTSIKLSPSLRMHIENLDFSIFGCKAICSIIEEYRANEQYFYLRFGGATPPKRPVDQTPPEEIAFEELKYVDKARRAFMLSKRFSSPDEKQLKTDEFVGKQRKLFYVAESLRRYSKGIYLSDEQFLHLKSEMLSAVQDTVEMDYATPLLRLQSTLQVAAGARTDTNPLDYQFHVVKNDDRRGICHHLSNEDAISWEVSEDEYCDS